MTTPAEALALANESLAIAEAATPGPWGSYRGPLEEAYAVNDGGIVGPCVTVGSVDHSEPVAYAMNHLMDASRNAAFIAFSRTALPALAKIVLEQSAEVERLRDALNATSARNRTLATKRDHYQDNLRLTAERDAALDELRALRGKIRE